MSLGKGFVCGGIIALISASAFAQTKIPPDDNKAATQIDPTQWSVTLPRSGRDVIVYNESEGSYIKFQSPDQQILASKNFATHQPQLTIDYKVGVNSSATKPSIAIKLAPQAYGAPGTIASYFYNYQTPKYLDKTGAGLIAETGVSVESNTVAIVSRHMALLITADNNEPLSLTAHQDGPVTLAPLNDATPTKLSFRVLEIAGPSLLAADAQWLQYSSLWRPLASLTRGLEHVLWWLLNTLGNSGLAILVAAIVVRLVTFPINAWGARKQQEFELAQHQIKPATVLIKEKYTGAPQSEAILKLYKEHNITPVSGLAGSVPLLVLVPILIAIFSITTESSLFREQSFLWITDLSSADSLAQFSFGIPGVGDSLNLLPILLGLTLYILSWLRSPERIHSVRTAVITAAIALLFYSFAAALLLFWLTTYALQILEYQIMKRHHKAA